MRDRRALVDSLFIGTANENSDLLSILVNETLDSYLSWRTGSKPAAPTAENPLSPLQEKLRSELRAGIERMSGANRFHDPQYLAHQQSDISIPAIIGSILGLLHNPNNVTSQSGIVTTQMEQEVADDLLTMVGFTVPKPNRRPRDEVGFCHLASGGTIANVEALWAARDLMYLPLSIQELDLRANLGLQTTNGGSAINAMSPWRLLGESPAAKIGLLQGLVDLLGKTAEEDIKELASRLCGGKLDSVPAVQRALKQGKYGDAAEIALKTTTRNRWNGYGDALSRYPPVILVAKTAHYSIGKAASVLGIGVDNVWRVEVDEHFRLDVKQLRKHLDLVDGSGGFPMAVVGIVGTTEEGSVDPIDKLLELRRERESQGRSSFWLHVDGAWGAYLRTVSTKSRHISSAVHHAVKAIESTDSVTVDPHKMGFLPYPCGAIAFRDDRIRFVTREKAPYIDDARSTGAWIVPPIRSEKGVAALGPFTLEGSRPGFPAIALKLSNALLNLDTDGNHGNVIVGTIRAAQIINKQLTAFILAGSQWRLVSLLPAPDTNLLLLGLRRADPDLTTDQHNQKIESLFKRFGPASESVQISKTLLSPDRYSAATVNNVSSLVGIPEAKSPKPLLAIRMSIMNPYVAAMTEAELKVHGSHVASTLLGSLSKRK